MMIDDVIGQSMIDDLVIDAIDPLKQSSLIQSIHHSSIIVHT
jgi:hypothetical protein